VMVTITCPDCKGQGQNICFVDYFASKDSTDLTGSIRAMKCIRCEGKGEVSVEMLTWIAQGKAIRDRRVHGGNYVDMHTMAKEVGLSLAEYSAIEMGRVDNTWFFEWLGLAIPEVTNEP
jgi:hypothetical protein